MNFDLLGAYQNGNYKVLIFSDGTKIRKNDKDTFIPCRIESLDCKITNNCDMGCAFCHEQSTPDGEHGDLTNPIIDTFLPYTEVAIGGGNPLAHPDLEQFLIHLKKLKCFPNLTINQVHFLKEYKKLKEWRDKELFYGLGISVFDATPELISKINEFPNAVVHTIAGITTFNDLQNMHLKGIKKILILGYKNFGRGANYYSDIIQQNIEELKENIKDIPQLFDVLSFDNLAIEQLDVKSAMTPSEWEEFYMGDDGCYTMYVDLVKQEYAQSSTSKERFKLLPSINEMFLDIRKRKEATK